MNAALDIGGSSSSLFYVILTLDDIMKRSYSGFSAANESQLPIRPCDRIEDRWAGGA